MLYIVVADGAIRGHADNLTAARAIADHVVNEGVVSCAVVFQFRDAQEVYAALGGAADGGKNLPSA